MGEVLGYWDIRELLPEHASMQMLDRLQVGGDGASAKGIKAVSMDEPFFQGHFPIRPIMPGVLQVAAMIQLATAAAKKLVGDAAAQFRLKTLQRTKFRKPVFPGDFLEVETTIEIDADLQVSFTATCTVAGQVTSSGTGVLERVTEGWRSPSGQLLGSVLPACAEHEGYGDADIEKIMSSIPHRFPFLLIDRLARISDDTAVGIKNISGNEPCFRGVRNMPFPGYLQIEAAAQVGSALVLARPENAGKLGYFMSIDHAEFIRPVFPGDRLVIELTVTGRGRFGTGDGAMYVGDEKVTEAALKFAIVDAE